MTMHAEIDTHHPARHDQATRLSSTLNSGLEQVRVQEFLSRYLPEPPAEVATVGGGPGIHATWLRSQGYTVELLDPVPHNIEQATAAGISAVRGDAGCLPWDDEYFDAALLAGPMYHLPEAADRRLALREAVRVIRTGGFVALIAINRAANLIGSTLANRPLQRRGITEEVPGNGHGADSEQMAQTTYRATQLRTELTNAGLRSVTIHGLTGPGGWLAAVIDAHLRDQPLPSSLQEPDALQTALACSRLADRYPELVPASSLLFAVGQRA
jgi:ubiquinone/menaquinone biosynthesis C-methylase UbiE